MSINTKLIQPLRLDGGSAGCLLIHGFTSSPADVRPLSKHLHGLGFAIREVLLPGHGTSFEDMARYGWRDWLQTVETELAALKHQCSRVWLLGFSMGGILALLAAARNEATGLVCISAPIWPRPRRTRYAFLLQYFQKYAQLGKPGRYSLPSWRYEQVAVKNVADLMDLIKAGKRTLAKVTVPALVVQGWDDRTIKPRSARYIYDNLGSAKKEIYYTQGEHMLLIGEQSPDICRLIGEFIKETGGDVDGSC
ncbi:MAG: alpha/beta fold hydrolase [Eubacteriales bacterium]|nr:alpha/beta fold hydrolase [Eubacteriales bacterium]MDD4078713.1 alpha/beta fold hydrolase [Eubacteriales bacterium]MDD4769306.1 alpha/beta fold hydrolase [Eubacteriales bacterium]